MKIQTYLGAATTMLLLLALFGACSQNPIGIFESIELERKILDDGDLANTLNVSAVTRAGGKYFAAAGALYYRDATDPDYVNGERGAWSVVTAPGTNYTSNSVVTANLGAGERVYAVFTSLEGDASGVYAIDPAATAPVAGTSALFSTADAGIASVLQVLTVTDGAGEWLVVSVQGTAGANDYRLYASDDGTAFAEITNSAISAPWRDAASDGTRVAFMSRGSVLVDEDGLGSANAAIKTAADRTSGDFLTGLLYDDSVGGSGLLWLADDGGHIYTSAFDVATAWNKSATRSISTTIDAATPFTDFALVPVGDGSASTILVGTRGYGYRVIGDAASATYETAPSSPAVDGSNYQASELSGSVVQSFFVDQVSRTDYPVPTADGNPYELFNGYVVFAGTTNEGLWRALSYGGAIQWVRE